MRTPLKSLPETVASWTRRARWLRWLDGIAAWLALWAVIAALLPEADGGVSATVAGVLSIAGALVPSVRAHWRPLSGLVGLLVSRPLRPGDRAWEVRPGEAELVLVTSRRGVRVVIARLVRGPVEGITVRRTQVLLIPADPSRSG